MCGVKDAVLVSPGQVCENARVEICQMHVADLCFELLEIILEVFSAAGNRSGIQRHLQIGTVDIGKCLCHRATIGEKAIPLRRKGFQANVDSLLPRDIANQSDA